MISIRDLSKELGRNENKFHQFIKKNNYPIDKIKLDDKKYRGQTVSVVSDEIADEIRELLKDNSMNVKNQKSRFGGYFYVIQLEPILDPNRIKLGFAVDAQERLRRHQCSAPNAVLLKVWECRVLWEKTIIDISTYGEKKLNTNKVDTECFQVENLEKVIAKINSFFELLEKY